MQLAIKLNQNFYIRVPFKLSMAFRVLQGTILKVVRLLYSIPKAGNYWFKIYYNHYIKELNMSQSTYNPYLLHLNNSINFRIISLQTNDTLLLANLVFTASE